MKYWRSLLVVVVAVLVSAGVGLAQESKKPGGEKAKGALEAQFKALDKNSDGFLTLEEFLADKKPDLKQKFEARFKAMDKDGDGKVSLVEFTTRPPHKSKKSKEPPK